MAEVESRAKDILFSDKNMDNIKMSRLITRQIQLIERLYEVFDKLVDHSRLDAKEVERIKEEVQYTNRKLWRSHKISHKNS